MKPTLRRCAALLLALAPAAAWTQAHAQDGGQTREQAALSEEQELLKRKLSRLRTAMERLAERYEAEGRTHAEALLRRGLEHIEERAGEAEAATVEELMTSAFSELTGGQSVEAIRRQEIVIQRLERLLSILMDRPDLDELDRELKELRELKRELSGLAEAEAELRRETEELREASRNDAQRSLEAGIQAAMEKQRELLSANESQARESGKLQLEALEAALEDLIRDQDTDRGVLEAWDPNQTPRLSEVLPELEAARSDEERAGRLEHAAEDLRAAAEGTTVQPAGEERQRALEELEAAAARSERESRASGSEDAAEAAEALRAAAEAMRAARSDETRAAAAEEAEARATELETLAAERRAAAAEARGKARQELEEVAAEESPAAGEVAREALEELERAEDEARTREATAGALRELRRGLEELGFLGQALSASQENNADRAESIEEGLERLEQGETPAGQEAREALSEAAQAMREAAQAAREERAAEAGQSAARAEEALERARGALSEARQAAAEAAEGESSPRAMAEAQEELAREAEELRQEAEAGSMQPEAQEAVEEALEEATDAMRQAAQELSQGRSGAGAQEQRRAMDALSRAGREAEEGVTPSEPEDRQRAEELAERQQEIEKKLYDFMERYREREEARPLPSLDDAQQSAQQAEQSLSEGDLGEAQQQEERAQQEIEEAIAELEEEEEQYQRLRDEELLFRIAEETQEMLDTHRRLMAETLEVDQTRQPDARATRSQRLRLRKISRAEEALAQRADEMHTAIEEEGSLVFAELIGRIQADLERVGRQMGQVGGYRSDERVQALQEDVERALLWLLEALEEEKERREQENQEQQPQAGGPQQGGDGENRLVPDVAELKLLRRMEVEVLDALDELMTLYPELADPEAEIDPLLLEDILRLAHRHERSSDLFEQFRSRLGLPDPDPELEPSKEGESDEGSTEE